MPLYGRYGTIRAKPGQRDALLAILAEGTGAPSMPGCRLYLVGAVVDDPDAIAVTEVWDDAASHRASLSLEGVQRTIAKARPLIAGFGPSSEFVPVSGATILSSQRRGQRS
jgi:quinol monooxygenase YgiN